MSERILYKEKFITAKMGELIKVHYKSYSNLYGEEKEIAQICRGHVINTKTNTYVQRPFDKFYNFSEYKSLPSEGWIFTEKIDGSLCIISLFEKEIDLNKNIEFILENYVLVTSMNSFEGEHVKIFKKYLYENESFTKYIFSLLNKYKNYTFLFEFAGPDDPHVTKYDNNNMIFLGMRDNNTGLFIPTHRMADIYCIEYPTPKIYNNPLSLIINSLKEYNGSSFEGFVGYHPDIGIVKFKREEYLLLSELVKLTKKSVLEFLLKDGIIKDNIPELLLKKYNEITDSINNDIKIVKEHAIELKNKYITKKNIGLALKAGEISEQSARAGFLYIDNKLKTKDILKILLNMERDNIDEIL